MVCYGHVLNLICILVFIPLTLCQSRLFMLNCFIKINVAIITGIVIIVHLLNVKKISFEIKM